MAYRERYKVTAPVARSTAYDYNIQLSKSHQHATNNGDTEDRNVMPHEVLFEHRDKLKGSNARIHGCSSVNGIQLGPRCVAAVQACLASCNCPYHDLFGEMENMRGDRVKNLITWLKGTDTIAKTARAHASDVLTSFFTYRGVAITPCVAGSQGGALARQGFSATRGGLMTIVNTGVDVLHAGDKVRMVIDVLDVVQGGRDHGSHISGIPRSKIVARLAHVRPDASTFADVANGITLRPITLRHDEPAILTPKFEYVGRLRFPWDWDHAGVVPPLAGLSINYKPLPIGVSQQLVADVIAAQIALNPAGELQLLSVRCEDLDFGDLGNYVSYSRDDPWPIQTICFDIANNILGALALGPNNVGADMWMQLTIRCCEAMHYAARLRPAGALAVQLAAALAALFDYLDVRMAIPDPLFAPLLVVRGMVDYHQTTHDGNPPRPLTAISPASTLGVANRLNALHEYKKASPAGYALFGQQYLATIQHARERANWNLAESTNNVAATVALCDGIRDLYAATHGGMIDVLNIIGYVGNCGYFVNEMVTRYQNAITHQNVQYVGNLESGLIRANAHRQLPLPAGGNREDQCVNPAVVLMIHSLI